MLLGINPSVLLMLLLLPIWPWLHVSSDGQHSLSSALTVAAF
jgi:hypothetical protein